MKKCLSIVNVHLFKKDARYSFWVYYSNSCSSFSAAGLSELFRKWL